MSTTAAPFAYPDATWNIPDRIRDAHVRSWEHLAARGEWWTGAERVSIAAEGRRASALLDGLPDPGCGPAALPEAAVFAIHKLIGDLPNVSREWYDETIQAEGMSDAHYIELMGVLTHVWSIDEFHRALAISWNRSPIRSQANQRGVALRALPTMAAGRPRFCPRTSLRAKPTSMGEPVHAKRPRGDEPAPRQRALAERHVGCALSRRR